MNKQPKAIHFTDVDIDLVGDMRIDDVSHENIIRMVQGKTMRDLRIHLTGKNVVIRSK